jgi:hypothetical protein
MVSNWLMGGGGFLTMKWFQPEKFALEHDSLVNRTPNPEEPLLITDLLITDYSPRLSLNRLAKPSGRQRPRRPIETAHQFPNQTAPIILNR